MKSLICSLLKSAEFSFENEWRISIVPSGDFLKDKMRIVGEKARLTLRDWTRKVVVSEVLVSPRGNRRLIAANAEIVKSKRGYRYEILKSDSAYNGR